MNNKNITLLILAIAALFTTTACDKVVSKEEMTEALKSKLDRPPYGVPYKRIMDRYSISSKVDGSDPIFVLKAEDSYCLKVSKEKFESAVIGDTVVSTEWRRLDDVLEGNYVIYFEGSVITR